MSIPHYDAWKTACPPDELGGPEDLAGEVAHILRMRGVDVDAGGYDWTFWGEVDAEGEAESVVLRLDTSWRLWLDAGGDSEVVDLHTSPEELADQIEAQLAR